MFSELSDGVIENSKLPCFLGMRLELVPGLTPTNPGDEPTLWIDSDDTISTKHKRDDRIAGSLCDYALIRWGDGLKEMKSKFGRVKFLHSLVRAQLDILEWDWGGSTGNIDLSEKVEEKVSGRERKIVGVKNVGGHCEVGLCSLDECAEQVY